MSRGLAQQRRELTALGVVQPVEHQILSLAEHRRHLLVQAPPARGQGQPLLTRIRRMPRDRYELLNDMFIDRHIEKIERRLGVMTDEEKLSVKKKMLAGFERARTLSDQEYLIEKTELARRLLPDDRKNKILRKNDLGKLGHFMLNPALLPLLKKMVRQK